MRGFEGISRHRGTDFLRAVCRQQDAHQILFGLWQTPPAHTALRSELYTLLFPSFVKYLLSTLARVALGMLGE